MKSSLPGVSKKSLVLVVGGLLAAAFGGFLINSGLHYACLSKYTYVDADRACGGEGIGAGSYDPLRDSVGVLIGTLKKAGEVSEASVYFRDLNSDAAAGIDEFAAFAPASLLKLPLGIALIAIDERQPGFLSRQIPYNNRLDSVPANYPSHARFMQGQLYTVEQLIEGMLKYSDNGAYDTLATWIQNYPGGVESILQSYGEMGVLNPADGFEESISVRRYANVLRTLYTSAYITPKSSEKVLRWLGESDFTDGLVAGVPTGIKVAHKFGEREVLKDGEVLPNTTQFHDCGIIYHPRTPYLLCVMTKGGDAKALTRAIKEISRMAYAEVDSR